MSLVSRVQNILMSPQSEWPVIAGEGASVGSLFTGYILPVAAIPPIASIIGQGLLGPLGLVGGVIAAIIAYIISLVVTYIVGFVAAKLAPSFAGRDDLTQGMKLAGYAYTASWVAGILLVIPGSIGKLLAGLIGLYSLYLLYLGTSPVMGVPQDKSIVYTIVLIVIAVVLAAIAVTVVGIVLGMFMFASM